MEETRREDRSSIVVSSSRKPRRVRGVGYVIASSSLRAVPLFVPDGRSFVPACARRRTARKGRQGRPSCCPDVLLYRCQAAPRRRRARREDQVALAAISSVLTHSKARPVLSTAQP